MRPLNSRTTNTVAAVKNWTFIGRSLKKYLYGIHLINWRAESYRAKCELYIRWREHGGWRIALTYFPTAKVAFLPFFFFGFTKKVSKIQQHFILWFRAVSFFLRLVSRDSWDGLLTKHTRKNWLGRYLGYSRRDHSHPLLSLYVCLFMIFIYLFSEADLDCACSVISL